MFSFLAGIADIFLIYYIYYRVLLLFFTSRTNKVIWGIVVIGILTMLVQALNLSATAWIMKKLWVAGAVAIVIVFQPEIRRALMTIGTSFTRLGDAANPFGRIMAMLSNDYSFIPPMIEAIRIASEERTGMLIVLEQEQGLRDIIEDPVTIDAVVTKELLLTIFFDKTLLHDGAVLIANNRLALAAGTLPLTEQRELSKVLGTRHRAALGLSENSDAIVLVVSEESGRVSMARDGKVERIYNLSDLEARLSDLYRSRAERSLLRKRISSEADKNREKKENPGQRRGDYKKPVNFMEFILDFFSNPPEIIKNNGRIKLISFALSLVTYLYVRGH